jgi:phage terminase large subunit-like protein
MPDLASLSLLEFIPALSPEFSAPYHLARWCELIEAALRGGVRGLCAVPIRHHKTETTIHGIAWMLVQDPTLRIILMVADHEVATLRGKRIRTVCEAAGVGPERGQNIILSWSNAQGGGVQVMSAKQSRLGQDCDALIFDDPLSEHDADTPEVRHDVDMAIAHYTARAGRTGGKRGSVLGVMSRWHPDDPIGRRLAREAVRWVYVHARAIDDEGLPIERAFAADVMPLSELKLRREELKEADPSERLWWAQFQNEPRADGGELFKVPARYITIPDYAGFRDGIGIDCAYSTKKTADYFAIVAVRFWGSTGYVRHVERFRADHGEAEARVRIARASYGGHAAIFSYMSGPEIGGARYLIERGLPIEIMGARYDKRTRAQKTIDRWNAGKILVPEHAPWLTGFLGRAAQFRGIDGDEDDEIDALVSVVDGMTFSGPAPISLGRWRY